jgi:hypothetical protein
MFVVLFSNLNGSNLNLPAVGVNLYHRGAGVVPEFPKRVNSFSAIVNNKGIQGKV